MLNTVIDTETMATRLSAEAPETRIQSERVRLLNDSAPTSAAGNLLIALVASWLLWHVESSASLLLWGMLLTSLQLLRMGLYFSIRLRPNAFAMRNWCVLLRVISLLGGLTWGSLPLFLFPADLPHQVFLPFIAAGLTGAALAGLAPDRFSVMLFTVPTLIPIIARFLLEGGEIPSSMAFLTMFYLAFLVAAARRNEQAFYTNLALRDRVDQHYSELSENERKYRTLSENIPGMVYRGTPDWRVEYISNSVSLCGYTNEELQVENTSWLQLVHPDDRSKVMEENAVLVNAPNTLIQQYRIRHKNGEVRWISDHKQSIFDRYNRFAGVDGIAFDISASKRAELALTEREAQLNQAQLVARLGSFDWRPQTGALQWSDEYFRLWGLTPQETQPDYALFLKGIHCDDVARVERVLQQALNGGGDYECVHRVVWPNGHERYIHGLGKVTFNALRQAIKMTGTVQDVTEQVEAENKIKASEQALKKLVFDLGQRIKESTCFNRITQILLDETRSDDNVLKDVVGLIPGGWVSPKDTCARIRLGQATYVSAGFVETQWKQSVTIPLGSSENNILEVCRLEPPDASTGATAFLPEESELLHHIAVQIAQALGRRQDQRALVAARDEANRASKAKSEFLSSMSHELRTPMNAILGFSQLMSIDETLNEENQESVREILKAGNHLLELINEVLDLAKVESGNIELALEPVEVDAIVEECFGLVTTLADKRDIRLSHGKLKGIAVRADHMRLKQVLLNLLSNAIKYNRENGSVIVEVKNADQDRLRLCVTDTGKGIPAENIGKLFQPFNRLDAEYSAVEGTGIGLTITRRIIKMMGGSVDVKSEVGVGSTFWIELPRASLALDPAVHVNASDENFTTEKQITKHTVLCIDDNPANLKLIAQILGRRTDIHLLSAHTSELGIELARSRLPDLILLDINMPGMNGFQVLSVFKKESPLAQIPVVAITANAMPHDVNRGMEAGFTEYLTKPLNIARFHAVVDDCLGKTAREAKS